MAGREKSLTSTVVADPEDDAERRSERVPATPSSLSDMVRKSLGPLEELSRFSRSLPSIQIAEALTQADIVGTRGLLSRVAEMQVVTGHSISESLRLTAEKMAIGPSAITQAAEVMAKEIIEEQSRRVMDMQRALITPFQQLQEIIKAVYPAYVGLIEATRGVASDIKFLDPLAQIRERLTSLPEFDFQHFAANIPTLLEQLHKFSEKDEEAVFDLLAKRGLTGMEEFLTPGEISHILKLKETKGVRAVDAYIFRQFRRNKFKALNAMVREWWKVPYLKKRKTIVLKALRAHKKGDYELAIPALLPLADGLSAEIVKGTPGLVKKTIYAKDAAALYRKREPEVWSVCFEQVVCSLVYKNYDPRSGKPPASSINRHGILHGSVLTYASELNSYRVIFLLNVMAKLAA